MKTHNVTLTPEGYTLDGKWRLVPVEPTYEMAILSLNGGLDYKLGVKAAPPPPPPQQSPGPDCRTCVWYSAYWKKNHYKPLPEPAP